MRAPSCSTSEGSSPPRMAENSRARKSMVQASPSSTSPVDHMRLSSRYTRHLVVEEVLRRGEDPLVGVESGPGEERLHLLRVEARHGDDALRLRGLRVGEDVLRVDAVFDSLGVAGLSAERFRVGDAVAGEIAPERLRRVRRRGSGRSRPPGPWRGVPRPSSRLSAVPCGCSFPWRTSRPPRARVPCHVAREEAPAPELGTPRCRRPHARLQAALPVAVPAAGAAVHASSASTLIAPSTMYSASWRVSSCM